MQNELGQSQKERHTLYDFTFYEVLKIDKIIETENRMMIASVLRDGGMGNYCLIGIEFPFCKMKRVLEIRVSFPH
jgi:hypothetical protein